ncbi:methyltransferase type 12 [Maritimibacter sp. 55A14]|uniref:methyltransferase domain-containing protein n=1 Tax=Maritimibacter sp. 55A14 TaxID=2174844 RepID=UPI000D60A5D4|nr:methyltransferase domain-containing protein [Maritimibacter sp. 55A14]PWE32061.1 methyltransferase type 12 [Maritimibacter sp. 55A14]
MTTHLHAERLAAVRAALAAAGARRVLDLGCGRGDLLFPLAESGAVAQITGLEPSPTARGALRARLARSSPQAQRRVTLLAGSALDLPPGLEGHDAAVLVEVIEHLPPERLSQLEQSVFRRLSPPLVVLTTPNAEFNALLGVPAHRRRHPDHRFEWDRLKFRTWARGVAGRMGYDVGFRDIGGAHPDFGGASQMAVFARGG